MAATVNNCTATDGVEASSERGDALSKMSCGHFIAKARFALGKSRWRFFAKGHVHPPPYLPRAKVLFDIEMRRLYAVGARRRRNESGKANGFFRGRVYTPVNDHEKKSV